MARRAKKGDRTMESPLLHDAVTTYNNFSKNRATSYFGPHFKHVGHTGTDFAYSFKVMSMERDERRKKDSMKTLKTFAKKFTNDWSMNLAGMLTYSLITAIFPILVAILTIAGLVLHVLPAGSTTSLADTLNKALPAQTHQVINVPSLISTIVKITGPLAIIALVGLIWAGSNLFSTMENAFSIIFRIKDRDFLPQRVMAVGMVIILGILLPISFAASSLITAGSQGFRSFLPSPLGNVLAVVGPIVSLLVLWLLFLIIYMVVPNIKVPFRDAWRGAAVAGLLFLILDLAFPLYFKFFLSGNAKYGTVALSVLVLIVWLWFFALITIIGAQVNAMAMGLKATEYDIARAWAQTHREDEPDQGQTPSTTRHPGSKVPAGRQTTAGTPAKARSSVAHMAAAPLRALALLVWLIVRPFVRSRANHTTPTAEPEKHGAAGPTGSAAG